MPYVNNPRYGEEGQPRQIFEHERSSEPVDPGMARVIVAVIGLALTPWLYPMLTAVVVAVGAGVAVVAREVLGLQDSTLLLVVAIPVLVVFVIAMRIEQRLGAIRLYRWARHAVRVLIPVALLYLIVSGEDGRAGPSIGSFFRDIQADSSLMGGAIAVAVVAQAILWSARWVRDDWHASLEKMKMRAPDLGW